jgi:hypothetical protein
MLDKLDDATTVAEFVAYNERRTVDIFGDGIGLLSFGLRHFVVSDSISVSNLPFDCLFVTKVVFATTDDKLIYPS